ncbi:MAG: LamG domain-containing protein, partial [Syntrophomonadaceae bacterium]
IVPPAGSHRMYLNAPGDKLDGWNKKKQTGSHTVWSTRNSVYDTGAVGTVRILNDPTDQIYLTNVDGSKKGLHLLPDGISVNTTNHTITEEFVIQNDGAGTDIQVIDDGSSADGWDVEGSVGTDVSITVENGRIKVTGTTDSSGRLYIYKAINADVSQKYFWCVDLECSHSCTAMIGVGNSSSNKILFYESRFGLESGINKKFVLPLAAPVGTTGSLPQQMIGTFSRLSAITNIRVGVYGAAATTAITFYIDNITACNGTWAQVEVAVPDILATVNNVVGAHKTEIYSYVTGAYHTTPFLRQFTDGQLDGTTNRAYMLDGTTEKDITGATSDSASDGCAMYHVGKFGQIAQIGRYCDSNAGSITYSSNSGTQKRIGFALLMPPSDGGRTDINKCRLKLVTYYDDINGNMVPDLSGNSNHGTTVGGVTKLNDGGLKFDGSTGYVTVPSDTGLDFSGNYTVSVLCKISDISKINALVQSRTDISNGFYLWTSNATVVFIRLGATIANATSGDVLNTTDWFLITAVAQGNDVKLYVNNTNVANHTGVNLVPIAAPILIGKDIFNTARQLNGYIKSIKIYTRGLSPDEVTALYNNQYVDPTGLVLAYKPTPLNMGSTTYEFTPQSLDHFTGLDNVGNWLAFERPDKRAEVFLFSRKLASLAVTEDENGKLARIEVGLKKGTKVARSWVRYPDFDADGNSDDVPNFIDKIVEQLQNKFAFTRLYETIGEECVEFPASYTATFYGDSDGKVYLTDDSKIYKVV